jgi:hypothetical protein
MRLATALIASLLAAPSFAQQVVVLPPPPPINPELTIADPCGACLPDPRRTSGSVGQCIPNPFFRPDITVGVYDPTASYKRGGVPEAAPQTRSALQAIELSEAEIAAAAAAMDQARLTAARLQQERQRDALSQLLTGSSPAIIRYKEAWPTWHERWRTQIPPVIGSAVRLSMDGWSPDVCRQLHADLSKVNLPDTPADDFSLKQLADSLVRLDAACEARQRFGLMAAASDARVAYADLAGRVYWRDALYRYLDAPPQTTP